MFSRKSRDVQIAMTQESDGLHIHCSTNDEKYKVLIQLLLLEALSVEKNNNSKEVISGVRINTAHTNLSFNDAGDFQGFMINSCGQAQLITEVAGHKEGDLVAIVRNKSNLDLGQVNTKLKQIHSDAHKEVHKALSINGSAANVDVALPRTLAVITLGYIASPSPETDFKELSRLEKKNTQMLKGVRTMLEGRNSEKTLDGIIQSHITRLENATCPKIHTGILLTCQRFFDFYKERKASKLAILRMVQTHLNTNKDVTFDSALTTVAMNMKEPKSISDVKSTLFAGWQSRIAGDLAKQATPTLDSIAKSAAA